MRVDRRDLRTFVRRLRAAIVDDRVFVKTYAAERAAVELGWDHEDVLYALAALDEDDFLRAERTTADAADLIWVFCPVFDDDELWIRLVERSSVVVVSLHRR